MRDIRKICVYKYADSVLDSLLQQKSFQPKPKAEEGLQKNSTPSYLSHHACVNVTHIADSRRFQPRLLVFVDRARALLGVRLRGTSWEERRNRCPV